MGLPILKIPITDDVTIVQGDTIGKIDCSFADEDLIDLTGATIKLQFNLGGLYIYTATSSNGITHTGNKSFTIDKIQQSSPFPEGVLKGDLQITDVDGNTKTYFLIELTISKQETL